MPVFVLSIHFPYVRVRIVTFFLSYYSLVLLTNSHEIKILVDS